jgi:hypothetical protein
MNTYDMISAVRTLVQKHSESEMSTPVILRALNVAYSELVDKNKENVMKRLIYKETFSAQSDELTKSEKVDFVINAYRKNSDGDMKFCREVECYNVPAIGTINYPDDDENNPLFIDYGDRLIFYPMLASTDVALEYYRKLPPLYLVRGTSNGGGTTITLDDPAPYVDHLSKIFITLYDSGFIPKSENKISTYTGSTKVIGLKTAVTGSTTYIIATYPLIESIASSIIKLSINYLVKSKLVDANMYREREVQEVNPMEMPAPKK